MILDPNKLIITDTDIHTTKPSIQDTNNNGIYFGVDGLALGKNSFKVSNDGDVLITNGIIGPWQLTPDGLIYTCNDINNVTQQLVIGNAEIKLAVDEIIPLPKQPEPPTTANNRLFRIQHRQEITPKGIASTSPQKILWYSVGSSLQFVKNKDLIFDGTNTDDCFKQNMILHAEFKNDTWPKDCTKIFCLDELAGAEANRGTTIKLYGGIFIPIGNDVECGLVGYVDGPYLKFKNSLGKPITNGNIFAFGYMDHKYN